MYIENIVIGTPIVPPCSIFGKNLSDWDTNEKDKTHYTEERFLPKILVDIGATKSVSEIRRNRKDLVVNLDGLSYKEIKLGKRKFFILVGNQENNHMKMKLMNIKDVNTFFKVIDECQGDVFLASDEGDMINLKSKLSQYLAIADLFTNGYISQLTLVTSNSIDSERFMRYMYQGQ